MIKATEKEIDDILERSISEVLPFKEELKRLILSGKKLKIYVGADATAPHLHLGHATNFILLEKLRKIGHEVIILFGDFTAMIGDPTDKIAARKRLTKKEVEENIKHWKKQVATLLDFDDKKNPAKISRNSKWLSKLNFTDLVDIASNFTVQRMLERDMFEKRIKEEKPIYLHEFFYPLMQGYDSVALDIDCEIGGTDQTFNMLCGRTLQKRYNNKEKFVIATTLLENPKTGKKLMSKSEGNYVALDDKPAEMFGKIMALPDEVMIQLFIDCTFLPLEEIKDIEIKLGKGALSPRDIKERLAFEIVKIYHGAKEAGKAKNWFNSAFVKKEILNPDDVPVFKVSGDEKSVIDLLIEIKAVSSRAEAKRLIQGNGVKINNKIVSNWDEKVNIKEEPVIKFGKVGFYRIIKGR